MKANSIMSLHDLVEAGAVQLTRGKVISKKDIAACPGDCPIYSSAKDNDGKFGEYGKFLFDEELITWSVDGGGRLFHRPKHKFSVTNVGGILRILDKKALDYRYLYYVLSLRHSEIRFDWVRKAHPSVIQKLYKQIPVPALSEQKRVVATLDEAFDGIATAKANAEKNLQNARAIFESQLQSVFDRREAGWADTTIGDQVTFQRGFDITKNQQMMGGVPVVSSGGIKSFHNTAMAQAPGVVIGRKGTLGKVFYLSENYWPHDTTLWIKDFKGNHPRFVYHFMRNLDVAHLDTGTANPALNRNVLHQIRINWPRLDMQPSLITMFDKLEIDCERLANIYERKIAVLDELKKTLLHCAFAGVLTASNAAGLIKAVA
jgi:type I restriction enzyme, S subunit